VEYFPLFLKLSQSPVLVIGGGLVAARKIGLLRAAGAVVSVVAPTLCAEVAALVAAGDIRHLGADFLSDMIAGQRLVIAATDDAALNAAVARAAEVAGIWINVVDDLAASTCLVPAIIDRSPVVAAVSTGGSSPVLATMVRSQIETLLPPTLGALAEFARRHRATVKARLPDVPARRRFWTAILNGEVAAQILAGDSASAEQSFATSLNAPIEITARVRCYLISVPLDPELLTLGAVRRMATAEVVFHDQEIPPPFLRYGRRDADYRPLAEATTAFDFVHTRLTAIRALVGPMTSSVYLSRHAGAWIDLLGGELCAHDILT
jgi:uroporphyrin-III C-methyltransferase / precorrin-2 dehydrogenase / sirohydrochlorin ferrochelatase